MAKAIYKYNIKNRIDGRINVVTKRSQIKKKKIN